MLLVPAAASAAVRRVEPVRDRYRRLHCQRLQNGPVRGRAKANNGDTIRDRAPAPTPEPSKPPRTWPSSAPADDSTTIRGTNGSERPGHPAFVLPERRLAEFARGRRRRRRQLPGSPAIPAATRSSSNRAGSGQTNLEARSGLAPEVAMGGREHRLRSAGQGAPSLAEATEGGKTDLRRDSAFAPARQARSAPQTSGRHQWRCDEREDLVNSGIDAGVDFSTGLQVAQRRVADPRPADGRRRAPGAAVEGGLLTLKMSLVHGQLSGVLSQSRVRRLRRKRGSSTASL